MNTNEIIHCAEEFAREKMKGYDPGHDWWHIERVRKLARIINQKEGTADPFILDLAAVLHDVADSKFNVPGSYKEIDSFLSQPGLHEIKDRVIEVIKNISFSNRNPSGNLKDPVYMILQDADRLDAIGAIGVARAFSYGSRKNNPIYVPADAAGNFVPSTVRHFYDKLLKLKDLMNTATGREMAEERHHFLEKFLEQFYSEWDSQTTCGDSSFDDQAH